MQFRDLEGHAAKLLEAELRAVICQSRLPYEVEVARDTRDRTRDYYHIELRLEQREIANAYLRFLGTFEGKVMCEMHVMFPRSYYMQPESPVEYWKTDKIICEASGTAVFPRLEMMVDRSALVREVMEK